MAKAVQWLPAAILLVSGCIFGPASDPAETATHAAPVTPHEPAFTSDTGALLVAVVNSELAPIENARVALKELDLTVETNVLGEAFFDQIMPATYALYVQAAGYEAVGRKVEVNAGEATRLQLVLEPIAIREPFSELLRKTGVWHCWFRAVHTATSGTCNTPMNILYNTTESYMFSLGAEWNTTVVEATTKPTSTYGARGFAFSFWSKNQDTCYWLKYQHSPARHAFSVGQPSLACRGLTPSLPEGPFEARMNWPAWNGNETTDVILTLEQRFEIYVTVFYLESGPSDYSALPDE